MLHIRRIQSGEADLYRRVRLAALADAPYAFCSTLGEASNRTDASWEEQAESTVSGADRATFLAFASESPVGLAAIYRDEVSPTLGHLIQVWLSPVFRGNGVAQKLVQSLLEWSAQNGFKKIETEVIKSNQEVIPFYLNLGFIEYSSIENRHQFHYPIGTPTPKASLFEGESPQNPN